MRPLRRFLTLLAATSVLPSVALSGQGTAADYQRSATFTSRFQGLAVDVMETPQWIDGTTRFFYRKSVKGGNVFVLVDAATQTKRPAFDHARLAAGLSTVAGASYTGTTLPFNAFTFDGDTHIRFTSTGSAYRCALADYSCTRTGDAPAGGGRGGRGGRAGGGGGRGGGRGGAGPALEPEPAQVPPTDTEPVWDDGWGNGADVIAALHQQQQGQGSEADQTARRAPDGKREAYIWNYNVYIRPVGSSAGEALSYDGSEGNFYTLQSVVWAPDSKKLAAYRVIPGYRRMVRYVVSSPLDQLQPKDSARYYQKPGDVVDRRQPVLFDVDSKRAMVIDNALFPNPYAVSPAVWRNDSRGFSFEYNQRGHQVLRVLEVDAVTGRARSVISEEAKTFITYSSGKKFRGDVNDGKETIWMSERDGWTHLYLYDGMTGQVKNQITRGDFVVRTVEEVDEANRQIWFTAGGVDPKQDPYFIHHYRINFDGTGLTAFTDANGTHEISWSPDKQYYVDTWSRIDMAPVGQLRRTSDQKVVMELEKGDVTELVKAGWTAPEAFVSKGRDGQTDIWGIIVKPTNFDAKKKYPVIEFIYAGPHGAFVPKAFSITNNMRNLAELGFILVQVDGMGTNFRSRAFHDVAWQNIKDAGFPDRILWHKAIAAKYSWYDIARLGIYGGSAGGQNSMAALLFHPEFYKVAVSYAGCHDNRMDKIWWNEQWMGWPLGPQYIASSNMEQAYRLQGRLLLVVGELDTNVDPASTMQVVNALIRSNKQFDLLVMPNQEHNAGRGGETQAYGDLKRNDFFVHHLMGVEPPNRNLGEASQTFGGSR